jgi:hypothetical protein
MSHHYSSPNWVFPHGGAAGPHRSVCGRRTMEFVLYRVEGRLRQF